jgi:hypothetical protein
MASVDTSSPASGDEKKKMEGGPLPDLPVKRVKLDEVKGAPDSDSEEGEMPTSVKVWDFNWSDDESDGVPIVIMGLDVEHRRRLMEYFQGAHKENQYEFPMVPGGGARADCLNIVEVASCLTDYFNNRLEDLLRRLPDSAE